MGNLSGCVLPVASYAIHTHSTLAVAVDAKLHGQPHSGTGYGHSALAHIAVAGCAFYLADGYMTGMREVDMVRHKGYLAPPQLFARLGCFAYYFFLWIVRKGLGMAGHTSLYAGWAGNGFLGYQGVARGAIQPHRKMLTVVECDGLRSASYRHGRVASR